MVEFVFIGEAIGGDREFWMVGVVRTSGWMGGSEGVGLLGFFFFEGIL